MLNKKFSVDKNQIVYSVNNQIPDTQGNVSLSTLPTGGTQGQLLIKQSSTDGDATWESFLTLLDLIYPVGSIYMSVNSTNPGTIFGGAWEQIEDTFLLASGATYSAGSTGGEATHTLSVSEMPSHTHGSKSLTGDITSVIMDDGATISTSGIVTSSTPRQRSWSGAGGDAVRKLHINATHEHNSVGSGAAHNNMPPYLAVNVWKRTA